MARSRQADSYVWATGAPAGGHGAAVDGPGADAGGVLGVGDAAAPGGKGLGRRRGHDPARPAPGLGRACPRPGRRGAGRVVSRPCTGRDGLCGRGGSAAPRAFQQRLPRAARRPRPVSRSETKRYTDTNSPSRLRRPVSRSDSPRVHCAASLLVKGLLTGGQGADVTPAHHGRGARG